MAWHSTWEGVSGGREWPRARRYVRMSWGFPLPEALQKAGINRGIGGRPPHHCWSRPSHTAGITFNGRKKRKVLCSYGWVIFIILQPHVGGLVYVRDGWPRWMLQKCYRHLHLAGNTRRVTPRHRHHIIVQVYLTRVVLFTERLAHVAGPRLRRVYVNCSRS